MKTSNVLKKEVLQQKVGRYTKLMHEDWFLELSNLEIAFIGEYLDVYEDDPATFLELLASRKKQRIIFQKLSKTVNAKAQMKDQRERVEQFLQQVQLSRLVTDLTVLPIALDYMIEKNVANYAIGHKVDDDFNAIDIRALRNHELQLTLQDEPVSITVQALIYFIFMNEMHHRLDESRIVSCKCEVAEATFAYSYAKALLYKLNFKVEHKDGQ